MTTESAEITEARAVFDAATARFIVFSRKRKARQEVEDLAAQDLQAAKAKHESDLSQENARHAEVLTGIEQALGAVRAATQTAINAAAEEENKARADFITYLDENGLPLDLWERAAVSGGRTRL